MIATNLPSPSRVERLDRPSAELADRALRVLQPAAALVFGGVLPSLIAGSFHPGHAPANDHPAAFTEYAASSAWTAVHLGQFLGLALVAAGMCTAFSVAGIHAGPRRRVASVGSTTAVIALARIRAYSSRSRASDVFALSGGWSRAPLARHSRSAPLRPRSCSRRPREAAPDSRIPVTG
jgi:hypothetical protein